MRLDRPRITPTEPADWNDDSRPLLENIERELVIVRAGYRCGSGYEWAQHVAIGRRSGVSDEDIRRLAQDPADAGWSQADLELVRATDQLVDGRFPSASP